MHKHFALEKMLISCRMPVRSDIPVWHGNKEKGTATKWDPGLCLEGAPISLLTERFNNVQSGEQGLGTPGFFFWPRH